MEVAGTTITNCLRTWLQAEFASSAVDRGDLRDTLLSSTRKLIQALSKVCLRRVPCKSWPLKIC